MWSAIAQAPDAASHPHVSRWYRHIGNLLQGRFSRQGQGVAFEHAASLAARANHHWAHALTASPGHM